MVHALRECYRVLKPNGTLIDLRPAQIHRRVGVVQNGRWRELETMSETFEDERAADRAIAHVAREKLFRRTQRAQFEIKRYMDTLQDFRQWLDEFIEFTRLNHRPTVWEKVEREFAGRKGDAQIVVRGPLVLSVFRKM